MAVLTSNYPASLDTTTTLGQVSNRAKTTLSVSLSDTGETSISVGSSTNFPSTGAVTINNEIFYYSANVGNVLTIEARARQGTTAAVHASGSLVYLRLTAGHWETTRSAVLALQAKLGIGSSTSTTTGHILGINGSGESVWGVPSSFGITSGGVTVGNAVTGGTNSTVLFKDGSGNVGSSSNLGWNGSVLSVTGNVTVTDEVYSSSWNTKLESPTKNAIYDRLLLLHNYLVVEDYASLADALTAAGTSADIELRIASTVNVIADTDIPPNVYVSFNGKGIFNISAEKTLTIRALINPGDRKLYTGSGKMVITRQPEVQAVWWTGKMPASNPQYVDLTPVMWDGMMCSGYGGMTLIFSEGRWRTSAKLTFKKKAWSSGAWNETGAIADGIVIQGQGGIPDPSTNIETDTNYAGTILQLTANSTSCFEIPTGMRSLEFKSLTVYMSSSVTGSTGFRLIGENTYHVFFRTVGVYGGDIGLHVKNDAMDNPLTIGLRVEGCYFYEQKVAGFKSESSNSSYMFIGCTFNPHFSSSESYLDNYGVWLNRAGTSKFVNCTFHGFNINERMIHSYISGISSKLLTIPNHGVPTGSLEPVTIRNNQLETNTVVGTIGASGAGDVRIVVTAAEMTGVTAGSTTRTIDFAVSNNDSASTVATKARTALNADIYITQFFDVGGTGAVITLLLKGGDGTVLNDATANFSIDNLTSSGLTAAPTSTTTASTTANLPSGYTDKQLLYFRPSDANTGYLYIHPTYNDGGTGGNAVNVSGGTNNTLRTQVPRRKGVGYVGSGFRTVPLSAFRVDYGVYQLSIDNCQDEGWQYSMIIANQNDRIAPFELTNNLFQSPIWLREGCYITSTANTYPNRAFKDDMAMVNGAHVFSRGDSVIRLPRDCGRTQHLAYSLSNFVRYSVISAEDSLVNGSVLRIPSSVHLSSGYINTPTIPAYEISRTADNNTTALLLRLGVRESYEEFATSHYDFSHLNSSTIPGNYKIGYLEVKRNGAPIYGGLYSNGHLAYNGRFVNDKTTSIGTSGTQNIDCSLSSHFHADLTGDVTYSFTNAVLGQTVTILLGTGTTSRTVTWDAACSGIGAKKFRTGTVSGYWVCKFKAIASSTMMQDGLPRHVTSTGTLPQIREDWREVTASGALVNGQQALVNSGSLVTLSLPTSSVYGDTIRIKGVGAGGWKVSQASGQVIIWSGSEEVEVDITTTGTSGYIQSLDSKAAIELVCTVANTTWEVVSVHLGVDLN